MYLRRSVIFVRFFSKLISSYNEPPVLTASVTAVREVADIVLEGLVLCQTRQWEFSNLSVSKLIFGFMHILLSSPLQRRPPN